MDQHGSSYGMWIWLSIQTIVRRAHGNRHVGWFVWDRYRRCRVIVSWRASVQWRVAFFRAIFSSSVVIVRGDNESGGDIDDDDHEFQNHRYDQVNRELAVRTVELGESCGASIHSSKYKRSPSRQTCIKNTYAQERRRREDCFEKLAVLSLKILCIG